MTLPQPGPAGDPVADLNALLGQLAGDPDVTPPAATPPAGDDAAPEPAYRNVEAFVADYLAHVVERRLASGPTSGVNWCPRWWAHPEAISRLYALWRAWETLRVSDPQDRGADRLGVRPVLPGCGAGERGWGAGGVDDHPASG
ncbi:DUF4913 domain-containing protein [Micromonospora inyonensis]|uniref:DUF4913 domain-containing protein n=1 Tax=Micromonospora inyonensis TaxID=47866 RepID=UPI000B8535A3|nr:DUF4913 domain-containing protein [Micromonospora inyonensis]